MNQSMSVLRRFFDTHRVLFSGALVVIVLFVSGVFVSNVFWIFVMSKDQVFAYLSPVQSECLSLATCDLQPGDILIRRYITERTKPFEWFTHSYFTHSAVSVGEGMIVEATGPEEDPRLDIDTHPLLWSDWLNEDIETWVVVRPLGDAGRVHQAIASLRAIADDPEYRFGIHWQRDDTSKVASCSDLVFRQYRTAGLITDTRPPINVGPDSLFRYLVTHPDDFRIIASGVDTWR